MKNPVKLLLSLIILLILFSMFILVWGKTTRVAYANYLYQNGEYSRSQDIYEDLAIDLPRSPQILHNLGLCLFQQGDYPNAVTNIQKAAAELKNVKENRGSKTRSNIIFYNLGTSQFKAGFQNETAIEAAVKSYQEALASFKKALHADPEDFLAKYNYEVTWLRLQAIMNQPRENKQEEIENLLNNTQNSDQFQAKIISDNSPPNGKDW